MVSTPLAMSNCLRSFPRARKATQTTAWITNRKKCAIANLPFVTWTITNRITNKSDLGFVFSSSKGLRESGLKIGWNPWNYKVFGDTAKHRKTLDNTYPARLRLWRSHVRIVSGVPRASNPNSAPDVKVIGEGFGFLLWLEWRWSGGSRAAVLTVTAVTMRENYSGCNGCKGDGWVLGAVTDCRVGSF